jgi:hypothetical protein
VTTNPHHAEAPLLYPFPAPGASVRIAFRELHLALNGSPEQRQKLGNPATLPRPWEPASCTNASLRMELWAWLEEVVVWLNHDYSWDVTAMIPTCWPSHPHLVHEIAVLADQRRRAGLALSSDALEEWHRYTLPAFLERMRGRTKAHCEEGHQGWPGRGRHGQHISQRDTEARANLYDRDVGALPRPRNSTVPRPSRPRLGLVDLDTGEITAGAPDD